ncbi:MAG: NUDIX hydrolase [Nitrospirota bacterium]
MSEKVLVVHHTYLEPYLEQKGQCFLAESRDHIVAEILEHYIFIPRDTAEYNFEYKQVIPYVIVRHGDRYLLLKRTAKQTESRLHGKYSLGIGGHVNPPISGQSENNPIIDGLYKELNEEIELTDPYCLSFIGVINDESTSVSKVHLGLLYVCEASSSQCEILEKEKMSGQWVTKDKLKEYFGLLETWSQIVYNCYISGHAPQGITLPRL